MKIKEFKKLDMDGKLDELFKQVHMIRAYQSGVIRPALEELFNVPTISEELKEDKIDEMVEFLKSNGYIVHKRV
jgi:hypothetical protein